MWHCNMSRIAEWLWQTSRLSHQRLRMCSSRTSLTSLTRNSKRSNVHTVAAGAVAKPQKKKKASDGNGGNNRTHSVEWNFLLPPLDFCFFWDLPRQRPLQALLRIFVATTGLLRLGYCASGHCMQIRTFFVATTGLLLFWAWLLRQRPLHAHQRLESPSGSSSDSSSWCRRWLIREPDCRLLGDFEVGVWWCFR